MSTSVRVALAALAFALAAPAAAQQSAVDPEVGSLVCDLSGECAASSVGAAADAAPHGARTSSTRGFTFKRTAPSAGSAAPAAGTTAMAGDVAMPGARVAGSAMPRFGSANLKLDFASGSSTLTSGARTRLAKLATALATPQLSGRRMRIEGYTDASGSAAANRDLSQRRAQAAADYLVSMGIETVRLEVVGYGSSRLLPGVAANSGENRRVMAVMLN